MTLGARVLPIDLRKGKKQKPHSHSHTGWVIIAYGWMGFNEAHQKSSSASLLIVNNTITVHVLSHQLVCFLQYKDKTKYLEHNWTCGF